MSFSFVSAFEATRQDRLNEVAATAAAVGAGANLCRLYS